MLTQILSSWAYIIYTETLFGNTVTSCRAIFSLKLSEEWQIQLPVHLRFFSLQSDWGLMSFSGENIFPWMAGPSARFMCCRCNDRPLFCAFHRHMASQLTMRELFIFFPSRHAQIHNWALNFFSQRTKICLLNCQVQCDVNDWVVHNSVVLTAISRHVCTCPIH